MLTKKISSIQALEILDSRGFPTLKTTITLEDGTQGSASVPSGASKGEYEAVELRDEDPKRYGGKGVQKAVAFIQGPLQKLLRNMNIFDQTKLDEVLIDADGTVNKSHYGANTLLSISLAAAQTAAKALHLPLYKYLGGTMARCLPCPMMNILNGGAHADNNLDFQEFMIRPFAAESFSNALRWGVEIFHSLKHLLKEKSLGISVGDEGGFAPRIDSDIQALDLLMEATERAGFRPYHEIAFALDCAASEFYIDQQYVEKKKKKKQQSYLSRTTEEQIAYLHALVEQYPIDSIEDGLAQNDDLGWQSLTSQLGFIQLVGDDLFVTNQEFLQRGIENHMANAILIKPNQIGTLTETIECIALAQASGMRTIVSHRSGDTEDTFIADLSIAFSSGQIKTGSLSRSERTSKYNRLLEIEQSLEGQAMYMGTWFGAKNKYN